MPSERPLDRLADIARNSDNILRYTAGMDLDAYVESDQMVRDAVERCFARISEAAYVNERKNSVFPRLKRRSSPKQSE